MVWMLWNNINNWIWNKEKSAATKALVVAVDSLQIQKSLVEYFT
jgi:hypothetical protein